MKEGANSQKQNPRSSPETFTGSVTLRKRVSKNVYDLDTVRMVPHPALSIESAALARHYLATYALFRVSSPSPPPPTHCPFSPCSPFSL